MSANAFQRLWRRGLDPLLVGLLALAAYPNILHNKPVLDDGWVIFDNPLIKSLAHLPRLFREPYNAAGARTLGGVFRPVTSATYALNYALGGSEVLGYHLVSLGLHLACTALVWRLARRLAEASVPTHARAIAFGSAALFAVHPAHVEAVTGMVGRAEELAALAALIALNLVCGGRSAARLLGAFVALALGVLSKESAAVAAPLYALIVWIVPGAAQLEASPGLRTDASRRALRSALGVLGLLGLAVAVYPAVVLVGPGHLGVPPEARWFGTEPEHVVLLTMTRALAEYFRILAWPHPLGVDFYYAQKIPFARAPSASTFIASAIWLGLLAAGLALRKRRPLLSLGVLWLFAALLPVLNLVRIGTLMGERLLYLPSVGFCLAVAALGTELFARAPRWLAPAALALLVAAMLPLCWQRNAQWHDAASLWEAELHNEPDDVVVNNNLAVEVEARGDSKRSIALLQHALHVAPLYWRAWVNLGISQHHLHDDTSALAALEQARKIEPTAPSPDLFSGLVHYDGHDLEKAIPFFASAARKGPLDATAHYWYGRALLEAGRKAEALPVLERAVELDPGNGWARKLRDQAAGR